MGDTGKFLLFFVNLFKGEKNNVKVILFGGELIDVVVFIILIIIIFVRF